MFDAAIRCYAVSSPAPQARKHPIVTDRSKEWAFAARCGSYLPAM